MNTRAPLSIVALSIVALSWFLAAGFAACGTSGASAPPGPTTPAAEDQEDDDEEPGRGLTPPPPEAPAEPAPPAADPAEPILTLPSAAELAAAQPPDPNAPADLKAPPADAKKAPSGLAWKVLSKGSGNVTPSGDDTVAIRHTGWMASSGVKFESSADSGQAVEYVLSRAVPGWIEGLSSMVTGEKRRFWIPGNLAHGDQPRRFGLPYGPLVYDIELVAIRHPPRAPEVPADLTSPPAEAKRTASGLVYHLLSAGTGKTRPRRSSKVEVHYSGWTVDGEMFDSSVARGQTATFGVTGVIRGWTEALLLMVPGDKMRVWIPAKLAYGDKPTAGSPAGPLVFDIELIAIK